MLDARESNELLIKLMQDGFSTVDEFLLLPPLTVLPGKSVSLVFVRSFIYNPANGEVHSPPSPMNRFSCLSAMSHCVGCVSRGQG